MQLAPSNPLQENWFGPKVLSFRGGISQNELSFCLGFSTGALQWQISDGKPPPALCLTTRGSLLGFGKANARFGSRCQGSASFFLETGLLCTQFKAPMVCLGGTRGVLRPSPPSPSPGDGSGFPRAPARRRAPFLSVAHSMSVLLYQCIGREYLI